MNFISNINPWTTLMGMGLLALSERLKNQDEPVARIAHVASLALGTGLVVYSTWHAYHTSILRHTRALTSLYLADNRLTASPDLSRTPALRSLNLDYNQLTVSPDLSRTPELRSLNLESNQLTASPDLSRTPALRLLNLGSNLLTASPDLSHTPALRLLNLGSNLLTASPDLSHTPALRSLNLGFNRLTASPDLGHTPELRSLDLRGNQLTASPDLSHTPELTYLSLGYNGLTASPDLSHTPALRSLHLGSNQLTASPNLSHTPALRSLHLGSNQLTASPDLSHTPALRSLDLDFNQLTTPPDLSHTPALRSLNLYNNQLTTPPDLSHTPALETLYLTGNRLTASPDLSHTPALRSLILERNQLTTSPDLSHTPALSELYLCNNRLTTLHDSILHLPRSSNVHAEGNRFSAEYAIAFQQRLQDHRLQHPDQGPTVHMSIADDVLPAETQTLEQGLRGWSDEFEEMFPTSVGESRPQITDTNIQTHFEPLLSLSDDDKDNLSDYLRRLRETKDYRNGTPATKKNVVLRVEKMLRLACENGEFKGKMLALINEGLTSCHDRVLITFNDIEIQWRIHQPQSESELLDLLVRVERYEQLHKHAKKIAEERGLGDEIETILHYQIALTKQLDLPISTEGMLYQAMSGVTQTMLRDARTKIASLTNEDLLSQSEHWRVYLEKKHAGAISKINEKFSDLLEVAGNYYDIYGIDDTETSSQKRSFLETHADFAQLLKDAVGINHYSGMANFIDRQRKAAITALGSESTDTLHIDGKERKKRKHH